MGPEVIQVRGVGKRYRLGEHQPSYGTLRDALSGLGRRRKAADEDAELWALRDVDLTVNSGEAVGLIGRNGAGKTTLLRILARITEPTVGVTRTRGRIGALLEVGTGFHPELSGRDNVFLGGAVMGMSRRDIRSRFEDIVDFAGVQAFMDTPLKHYSSGMRLRLAFAVAAHLEPDLLFVDEVLAVGDFDFQRRCLRRMATLQEEGRTVVVVSHDLGAITRLCSRAAWLDHGKVRLDGDPGDVVREYMASMLSEAGRVEVPVSGPVGIRSVALVDAAGEIVRLPERGQPLTVELALQAVEGVPGLDLSVAVVGEDGTRLIDEAWSDQDDPEELTAAPGDWTVRLHVPPLMRASRYMLSVWLGTETRTFLHRDLLAFEIAPRPTDRQEWQTRPRLVQPAVQWSVRGRGLAP